MPMVETSVAVATPATTDQRMTKGSEMAGIAARKVFPISGQLGRESAGGGSDRDCT